jgi:hypothetical protein
MTGMGFGNTGALRTAESEEQLHARFIFWIVPPGSLDFLKKL